MLPDTSFPFSPSSPKYLRRNTSGIFAKRKFRSANDVSERDFA